MELFSRKIQKNFVYAECARVYFIFIMPHNSRDKHMDSGTRFSGIYLSIPINKSISCLIYMKLWFTYIHEKYLRPDFYPSNSPS